MTLALSPQVEMLHQRFLARYPAGGTRILTEDDAVQARNDAILAAYRDSTGQPPILRRAGVLAEFAARMPVVLEADDMLAGRQTFNRGLWANRVMAEEAQTLGYAATTGHIVHDYESLLRVGTAGLHAQIDAMPAGDVRTAFRMALDAFARYIARHADAVPGHPLATDLAYIAHHPPATFAQAVQLVWFAQTFLHVENPSAAISFGRLDQYLWPFLRDDLAAGRTTPDDARNLIAAFFLKCCEGEESQNAVLGGVDADGRDATNPVSILCLEAMRLLQVMQPTLCVRVHPESPAAFLRAACELAVTGNGNPGFMHDAPVIAGLQALGIPLERARDWGVVGCYEATPHGDCYPNTVLGRLDLVEALSGYLGTAPVQSAADFAVFLTGWEAHLRGVYAETLARCQASWCHFRDHAPSPFGSIMLRGCIARNLPLEAGAAPYNLVGINILGLGTLVDSLHAVREVVFIHSELSLAALATAMAADFPDDALRERLRRLPGRYGTDDAATNALAREVSTRIARMVLDSRLDNGVRPYPGFFAFSADIYARGAATPDGRRRDDLISYGVGPAAIDSTPTAILAAAAHAAHALAACGNPLALTLARSDIAGLDGWRVIQHLVETYFALGGSHLHVNVLTFDELRQAQANPAAHPGLTVRVSGYSARFVEVERTWQDALIARAARGL